jgi:predicted extracellular nuclease
MKKLFLTTAAMLLLTSPTFAGVLISEWAYAGTDGEFIEFTNYGPGAVDFTGWSFDDDSQTPGGTDLSAFGVVAAGESVVLTDVAEADFRTAWGLDAAVKIIGGNLVNLGRNDEINLFNGPDAVANLVDRLTFGDQNIAGTIRTQNVSGNPGSAAALGANDVAQWVLSATGDSFGSRLSANGDIGNPGIAPFATAIPEPATAALIGLTLLGLAVRRR